MLNNRLGMTTFLRALAGKDWIEKDSHDWQIFLENLSYSKSKSNRDVLCLSCWKILKYEECVKHKLLEPDHSDNILTSKQFSSEDKFISIARENGKV
jgi:hypothetical protein